MKIKKFRKPAFCFLIVYYFFFSSCRNKENLPTQPTYEERLNDFWGNYPELGEGAPTYTVLPIDIKYVDEILPLGHLIHQDILYQPVMYIGD